MSLLRLMSGGTAWQDDGDPGLDQSQAEQQGCDVYLRGKAMRLR